MSQVPADEERPAPAEDPRWRIEHLPLLTAVSTALLFCAFSAGYLARGVEAGVGAAAGVLIVTVSFTMSTLVIAWADTVRPALLLPLGMLTYVVKYSLLGVILAIGVDIPWPGWSALGWGIVAGVVVWTGVQAWWVHRRVIRKVI
ncbi:hypothetical protein [Actinoplanes couchii]|uniref:hypothetical protein n=1 Tax=Actinoplanes couchii TaxID=403638 RepID=UPI0019440B72|nr:hypothetical protein [Actinoplanes couchii]MDR6325401.1 hypothetical protein [Actinoplanes couchii]